MVDNQISVTVKSDRVVDERGNVATLKNFITVEKAIDALRSLTDCYFCLDCFECKGCRHCEECVACVNCTYCSKCDTCEICWDCWGCTGCDSCFRCSKLCWKENISPGERLTEIPEIPDIHRAVYEAASKPCALDMSHWHTCETTHCRAGWVVRLAGDAGFELESKTNTPMAALLIYAKSGYKISPSDFYHDDANALENMRQLAEQSLEKAE